MQTSIRCCSYVRGKGRFSPWIAYCLLPIVLPIIGFLYLLVRCSSWGPGFYSQTRLGQDGEPFTLYKLRTMIPEAEKGIGPVWAAKDDPRVTKVGRFLRKYHLDELPQILNVARGEMCFVGPRPERPAIAQRLNETVLHYMDRLQAKPGITGISQIYFEADTDVRDVRRKLEYDLAYLQEATLWIDIRIVVATFFKLLPACEKLPKLIAGKINGQLTSLEPACPPIASCASGTKPLTQPFAGS